MSSRDVKVYTLSTCSHCKSAKQFLNQNQIEYDAVEVDLLAGDERQGAIEAVKQVNPRGTFPTLVIDDRVIVGFKEDEIREALGL